MQTMVAPYQRTWCGSKKEHSIDRHATWMDVKGIMPSEGCILYDSIYITLLK